MSDKRQKNQLADGGNAGSNQQMVLAWEQENKGESPKDLCRGTESLVAKRIAESPAFGTQWMEEICGRDNCLQALARVKANQGSPGVDGMTVQQLPDFLKERWLPIREQLLRGTYEPKPVKRVEIPKPGGGVRKLGIPTVLDRMIQQAVMQVVQRSWDRTFFRSQLRVSAWALGASGGGEGTAVYCRRSPLGGGHGLGEIL